MEAFYEKVAEIFDVAEVKPADVLREFEAWDSLSLLSLVTMIGSDYRVEMSARDLRCTASVGELYDAVLRRQEP